MDQFLQDHYEDPYHEGRCEHPTHRAEAELAECGDRLTVELRIVGETLKKRGFKGQGCPSVWQQRPS